MTDADIFYDVEDMEVGRKEEFLSFFFHRNARGEKQVHKDLSDEDVMTMLDALWRSAAKLFSESTGGLALAELGYLCNVMEPKPMDCDSRYKESVQVDRWRYRTVLLTPKYWSLPHQLTDSLTEELEIKVRERIEGGSFFRFLWGRVKDIFNDDIDNQRRAWSIDHSVHEWNAEEFEERVKTAERASNLAHIKRKLAKKKASASPPTSRTSPPPPLHRERGEMRGGGDHGGTVQGGVVY
jgi:hypothetical protein